MSNPVETSIVAISGSLRKGSFNTKLLHNAVALAPDGISIEIADISEFPVYNADVQAEGIPAPVTALGAQIAAADAVLFATPEYNYSIPGVLKNAIDWVSRLQPQPFFGKPVAVMGASGGRLGSARAQYHLRQVFIFLDAHPLNKPEIFVGTAHQQFDEDGKLKDEMARDLITQQLAALADWTRRLAQE